MLALLTSDPRELGTYRLVGRLGSGCMGVVYAGVDAAGRRVAVKLMHEVLSVDVEFRRRFSREISVVGEIEGACIARVLSCDSGAERSWLAREYIAGPTLEQHAQAEAPLEPGVPSGAEIMQPTMRLDRPVKAYRRWLERIPSVLFGSVLAGAAGQAGGSYEVATMRNYQSLMPLSHDARKPTGHARRTRMKPTLAKGRAVGKPHPVPHHHVRPVGCHDAERCCDLPGGYPLPSDPFA